MFIIIQVTGQATATTTTFIHRACFCFRVAQMTFNAQVTQMHICCRITQMMDGSQFVWCCLFVENIAVNTDHPAQCGHQPCIDSVYDLGMTGGCTTASFGRGQIAWNKFHVLVRPVFVHRKRIAAMA